MQVQVVEACTIVKIDHAFVNENHSSVRNLYDAPDVVFGKALAAGQRCEVFQTLSGYRKTKQALNDYQSPFIKCVQRISFSPWFVHNPNIANRTLA